MMSRMPSRTLRILALSTGLIVTHAAPLSSSCTSALGAVISNTTLSACLSLQSLAPLLVDGQVTNSSVIPTSSAWLNTMCSLPECSVGAIAWGINTVTSGCQTEISDALSGSRLLNGDPSTLSTIATVAPSFYSAARKLACLWELGQNCAIKTATAFESFVEKPLSVPNLLATLKRLTSGRFIVRPGSPDGVVSPNNIIDTHDPASGYGIYFDFDQAPTDLVCTSCVKAAFNSVKSDPLVSPLLGGIQPPLQDKCGASFTDGGNVVGISNNSTAAPLNNPNNTGGSISIPATLNYYGIFSAVAISSLTMILFKAL